jgi:putative GTP pyrophosphokinase
METITIDWNKLKAISYQSHLDKSLKNTLRKFDKKKLFDEIGSLIFYFTEHEAEISHEHRIKSLQSCNIKYEKYYPSTEVEKVLNDILGIRIIIDDYSVIDKIELPKEVNVADMHNGKAHDDGYRAVHMYYQKDHYHYPIEIQFMTPRDRQFNEWLHIFLYKYVSDNSIGVQLRVLYDEGIIVTEMDFRKEMQRLCVTL